MAFWTFVLGLGIASLGALTLPLTSAWVIGILAFYGAIVAWITPAHGWQSLGYLLAGNTFLLIIAVAGGMGLREYPMIANFSIALIAFLVPWSAIFALRVAYHSVQD